jgi:ribokinase
VVAIGGCGVSVRYAVSKTPGAGETVMASDVAIINGGKAANQAIGAAKLGADASLVSAVGDDMFSSIVLKTLANWNVSTSGVVTVPGSATMVGAVITEDHGDNRIIVGPGALATYGEAEVKQQTRLIGSADVCIVSLEIPLPAAMAALEIARTAKVTTFLNPSPSRDALLQLISRSDVVVVNEHEARMVALEDERPEDALRQIVSAGARAAIVTLGERGALIAENGNVSHVPAAQLTPEEIVDTAGAGDAFITATAVAVANGLPLREGAGIGVEAAARILRGPGFVEALEQWHDLHVGNATAQ